MFAGGLPVNTKNLSSIKSRPKLSNQTVKKPKLTELERLALRCGSYGGIKTETLSKARKRANEKISLGARLD
jgi:hypothetical protein